MGADYAYCCPNCQCLEYHSIEQKKCYRCKGSGYEWVMVGPEPEKDVCPVCNGEGVVTTLYQCADCKKEFKRPANITIYDDE